MDMKIKTQMTERSKPLKAYETIFSIFLFQFVSGQFNGFRAEAFFSDFCKCQILVWAVVVVKWSACSPSFRRYEFESCGSLQFFCKIVFERNKNEHKRGRGWPTLKKYVCSLGLSGFCGESLHDKR